MKIKITSVITLVGILMSSLFVNAETSNRGRKKRKNKYRVSTQHEWRKVNIGRTCSK